LTPTTQKPPEALLLLLQNTEALFLSLATAAMQMIEEENNALRHLRKETAKKTKLAKWEQISKMWSLKLLYR
jgi:hypothetical protein